MLGPRISMKLPSWEGIRGERLGVRLQLFLKVLMVSDIMVMVPENYSITTPFQIGGPGHRLFSSFSAAVLVAGGSGITFALSVIQDLVQKDLKGESRVKVIELVWIVQDPG